MKKKIDFRQIEVSEGYEGKDKAIYDVSKTLSATIYKSADTYEDFELGKQICFHGEVEIDKSQAETIKQYASIGLKPFVRPAINDALDNLFNNN